MVEEQKSEQMTYKKETPRALLRQRFDKQSEVVMLERKHFSTIISKEKVHDINQKIAESYKSKAKKKGKN